MIRVNRVNEIAKEFSTEDVILLPQFEFIDTETDETFMLSADEYIEWAGDNEVSPNDVYFKVFNTAKSTDAMLFDGNVITSGIAAEYVDLADRVNSALSD